MAISQRQDIQIELAYLWFPAVYCWPSSLLCPSHHCGRCHHWAVGVWHCQLHRYSKQLCYLLFTRNSWILKKPQPTLLRLQYVWYELEAVLTICLIWAQSCPYNMFDMSSKLSLQYVWYELKAVLTIRLMWAQSCPYNMFDMDSKLSLHLLVVLNLTCICSFSSLVYCHQFFSSLGCLIVC